MNPLVSVVVPTYNQSEYIEKTLDSILNQTYKNIEIIVSDDSPNDFIKIQIQKYLDKYSNINYIHNTPSKGEFENYRFLLYEMSSGEWILNVDGDDFLYREDFIQKAINYIVENDNIVLVTSKKLKYDVKNDKYIKAKTIPDEDLYINGEWLFFNHCFNNVEIPHIGTIFNRKKAIEIGFYEYEIPSKDRESFLKLSLTGNIVYLSDYYGVWVLHGDNHSQNVGIDELFENVKMYDRLYDFATKNNLFKIKLFFWKLLSKYKLFRTYYCLYKEYDRIKLLDRLKKYSKLYELLIKIDIRNLRC